MSSTWDWTRTVEGWTDAGSALLQRGADLVWRKETPDEAALVESYERDLSQAHADDLTDISELGCLERVDVAGAGSPTWLLYGSKIPARILDKERLWRFFISQLEDTTHGTYSLIYVHTNATYADNCPGITWLIHKAGRLPERFASNLEHLVVLHPDLHVWAQMQLLRSTLLPRVWSKAKFLLRVEFLWEIPAFPTKSISLPDYVVEHDRDLESSPLQDFYISSAVLPYGNHPESAERM